MFPGKRPGRSLSFLKDMEVKEIKDKKTWEDFFSNCRDKTFLQSWNWGECQKETGGRIWRIGFFDGKTLVATSLVQKVAAKRGTFLLIQHGPTAEKGKRKEVLKALVSRLKRMGKEEGASFIRMNPLWGRDDLPLFKEFGFKEAPMHASAYESTLKLDIARPGDELLGNMRKTTRYLIRQALKNKDIAVEKSENPEDASVYQKLNNEAARRHRFVPFSFESVDREFRTFLKDKEALFLFGKYKGEVAAAALIIFWGGIGFYHQAASVAKYARFSIPYLLQWEAILEAKKRGCKVYDFWGFVDPQKYPRHPWAGPTLFKMGFGGKACEYVKTQDYPLSGKYYLTYIFESLRKIKRGL